MVSVVFFIVIIIFLITLYATDHSATIPNKNLLLGVTLPNELINSESVKGVVKEFQCNYNLLFGFAFIFAIPLFFLSAYPSLSLIYMFTWIILLLYINNKITIKYFKKMYSLKKELMVASNLVLINDEDEDIYWERGYYSNPNDTTVMVEKRIGFGMTVNMATKKGKWLTFGPIIPVIVIVVFLMVQLVRFDFGSFNLKLNGENVEITAPLYGYSFNINTIEEIKLIEILPSGYKTNGAATNRYSIGNFNLNDYGKSKVYIYKNSPPYLVIKLRDQYVFINGKTPVITEGYYKLLKK